MRYFQKLTILGSAALLAASPAFAQDETSDAVGLAGSQIVDLQQLTCWDVVTVSEDDRAYAMTLLYGYMLGQKSQTTFTPRDIQVAIVSTMTECADKPESKVLDVLKKHIES